MIIGKSKMNIDIDMKKRNHRAMIRRENLHFLETAIIISIFQLAIVRIQHMLNTFNSQSYVSEPQGKELQSIGLVR